MIASLSGSLIHKSPTEVTVQVQGVGYAVHIPLSTFETLGETGSMISLLTYLHVREDALQLYGFATMEEREMFRLLISVSGIGPKMALGILSGTPVAHLKQHIVSGRVDALIAIPGIGKKLAERLVVELREKISKQEAGPSAGTKPADPTAHLQSEAILALTSLGYTRGNAEKAVTNALSGFDGKPPSLEALIKASLQSAT